MLEDEIAKKKIRLIKKPKKDLGQLELICQTRNLSHKTETTS
jgi:hypothetical protein